MESKNISQNEGYSLRATIKDKEIVFGENEKILDIISVLESLAGTAIPPEDPKKKPAPKDFDGIFFFLFDEFSFLFLLIFFPDH